MSKTSDLSAEDRESMAKYNIKSETKTVFHAGGYKYDRLSDAIRYAVQAAEKARAAGEN